MRFTEGDIIEVSTPDDIQYVGTSNERTDMNAPDIDPRVTQRDFYLDVAQKYENHAATFQPGTMGRSANLREAAKYHDMASAITATLLPEDEV